MNTHYSREAVVSVCVPTFNGSKDIARCLDSVICQSFSNIEILLVDDCSSDDTVNIAKLYAKCDPRIRIVQNPYNFGLVENWNNCIHLARGNWIKFQFQDDTMKQDCVEALLMRARKENTRFVLCGREYLFRDSVPEKKKRFYSNLPTLNQFLIEGGKFSSTDMNNLVADYFLGKNFLGEPIAGMFQKSIVSDYGVFDQRLKQICDFEYWCRIAIHEGVAFEPRKLVTFTVHGGSVSAKNGAKESQFDRVLLGYQLLHGDNYVYFQKLMERRMDGLLNRYQQYFDSVFATFGFLVTYRELRNLGLRGYVSPSFRGWIQFFMKKAALA